MTRILGIDPGSQRTGVGIIDVDAAGRVSYVHHQPLVLLGAVDFPQRMKLLVLGLADLCREYQPHEVAIEKVFMARNPDSALKLGQAAARRSRRWCCATCRCTNTLPARSSSPWWAVVAPKSNRFNTWSGSCST